MSDIEKKEHPESTANHTENHEEPSSTEDSASGPAPTGNEATDQTGTEIDAEFNEFNLKKPKLKELIRSSDSPSRYLTWLSISFGVLAVCCYGLLVQRYVEYRKQKSNPALEKLEEEKLYGGWLNNQKYFRKPKEGEEVVFTQALGEFRVLWTGSELRADLVAECTDEATCNALKDQPEKVHDVILPLLQSSSEQEVLNPNRKLELRRLISEKLNELKFKGKVIQIDFSDLTVEPAGNREGAK